MQEDSCRVGELHVGILAPAMYGHGTTDWF